MPTEPTGTSESRLALGDLRFGVDLGGTKIAGVVLEADGTIAATARLPTPGGDYSKTLDAIGEVIARLERQTSAAAAVGIGTPGSKCPSNGLIQNANSTWLNNRPLDRDLEEKLGRPVRLANDANCFALSEAVDGAGTGSRTLFGVILGTGCGGGIVHEGRLLDGPRGIGGEWGHNPLPWPEPGEQPGPPCWCGKNGCIESWVSGPGLAGDFERHTGRSCAAHDIAQLARDGDVAAKAALRRHADRLARSLACVVNLIDPEVVVLGGGLSEMSHLYKELPERMSPWIFSADRNVRVRPPVHGSASGVRGAAWLWDREGAETICSPTA